MTFTCKLLTIEKICYKGNKVSLSSAKPLKKYMIIHLIPASKWPCPGKQEKEFFNRC